MSAKDEQVRNVIAEQASEWFVANDEAPLGAQESGALVSWLKASPMHVGEFLGVAAVARDLHAVGADGEFSVERLLARAHSEEAAPRKSGWSRATAALAPTPARRWRYAAAAVAVAVLATATWTFRPATRVEPEATAIALRTGHGEQQSYRLVDGSVVRLNTDSAVTVRYLEHERVVALNAGEAEFEVAHERDRMFRVLAGPVEVVDLGTRFDVRLKSDRTVVTVVEGHVAVGPASRPGGSGPRARPVELSANQQLSVASGLWPAVPMSVDAQRSTAWLHRQIAFDHEPLARVAEEFNRYAQKPVNIVAPELRALEVSGVFSTDDADEFLAFLRSLDGVAVEVTATEVRVSHR